ncbi:hypothetical protein AFGD_009378 [Aspergillus flavus]|nr:hypothetical protein NYO67_2382 [Aspergillus flavus]RAQ44701.1 hypothetical protein AFGD_009378 [Aspergillus flavus]
MSTAQDQYIALINASEPVKPAVLNSIFDKLPPIKPNQLIGEWNGGFFDTGHQVASTLKEIRWVDKSFKSTDDVDPVIIEKNGERTSWGKWGFASLKEMVYRGVVSTTMIYDERPVFDHFRYVNDKLIAGIMEGKTLGEDFFFYLKR